MLTSPLSIRQMKIISILSALAFALPTAFGHGHVMKWTIDGVDHAGFNPSNADELGATAERPTTNSDQGELLANGTGLFAAN
jgi:hypothetical protein